MKTDQQKQEWLDCSNSPIYFIREYCQIYDATLKTWIPFDLWPEQAQTLKAIQTEQRTIILKARQLGLTWLCLSYALWLMLFKPISTILLFSRRETESMYLLNEERLRGIYNLLPDWMKARSIVKDDMKLWTLSNGSTAKAFPTSAGDSYTASFALVDEADLAPDLGKLLTRVQPTIDGGGQIVLLSRSDKRKPSSTFKKIYRAAKKGKSPWKHIFLPWNVHPGRDEVWYNERKQDILSRTASLDDLHEQYPATDGEALKARTLDKRIPSDWLEACYKEAAPIQPKNAPSLPGLVIYKAVKPGQSYVIGVDTAEGNPTSDDSPATVMNTQTGLEVAKINGKFQPSTLGAYVRTLAAYYNSAGLMIERNNHGHAVILWLFENPGNFVLLPGRDGKPGWNTSKASKALMYDWVTDIFRNKDTVIHSFDTYMQLTSIEGSTLRAPDGEMDDLAMSFCLALVGRIQASSFWTMSG